MGKLTKDDLNCWLDTINQQPTEPENFISWIEGPLRSFFPYQGVILGYGELVAGELKVTHMIAVGHSESYVQQLAKSFELERRGCLQWWFSSRRPFYINPASPPEFSSAFELEEIREFNLQNVAGHGVLNIKANAGAYFGFSGVREPLSEWHIEALHLIAPVLNHHFLIYCSSQEHRSAETSRRLTARQKEIVRHVATGLNDKQIARLLDLSEKTIRNQLTEVYRQYGVNKRAQLIALLK